MAPRRMSLANVETGETRVMQFNPTKVTISIEAFYNRLKSPGASHEELQYSNTGNTRCTFRASLDGRAQGAPDVNDFLNYFLANLSPPEDASTVTTGAPPRVLFSWPGWIALVTRQPKLTANATRFSPEGPPDYLELDFELEESRTSRLGSGLVRRSGLRRAA
jgi:hypothetical protein